MGKYKFSVLVPVYNTQRYLKECADSILKQTYDSFELILVDDGSTDESGHICDCYMEKYPNQVSVIHKKNEGLISARRAGLKAARGEYICFVDSDDYIRTDMLEKVSEIIDRCQPDVVVFNSQRVDAEGNFLKKETSLFEKEGIIEKNKFFRQVIALSLNSLCLKICRRNLFDTNRDYSSWYKISRGEDLLQSIPVIYHAKKFYYSAEYFYYYRKNPDSILHTYQKNQYYELDIILPRLYRCMTKLGYDDTENIRMFYEKYAEILWICLYVYFKSNARIKEFKSFFAHISGFEYVQRLHRYIQKNDCWDIAGSRKIKIALKLFYAHKWRILICYVKLWLMLNDWKSKINENRCAYI